MDLTTRILLEKYAPNDPRLTEVVVEKQADGSSEEDLALLEFYGVTAEEVMRKREHLFKSWGLDTAKRYANFDEIIAIAVMADAHASVSKSVITDDGESVVCLVMSSKDYTDAQITKACTEFNSGHLKQMSHSFQLPVSMYGYPANSWVLVLPNGEKK